jgi:hypothetical protein
MSPYVVHFLLKVDALADKSIGLPEVRGAVEGACCAAGSSASAATSDTPKAHWAGPRAPELVFALRVRALANDIGSAPAAPAHEAHEARELTVCRADGTSHVLMASPSTTVLEVKQHVRRQALTGEEESARPFFWQDEHAVQRQHIFVAGVEDELAGTRSMGSLGSPAALFLLVDTDVSFRERLRVEAEALRAQLEGAKLRDLARCGAAAAEAGGAGAGAVAEGSSAAADGRGPPCKKARVL